MKLVNHNPNSSVKEQGDFFNHSILDFFGVDFAVNIPSINVIETANNFRLELAAPGLEKKDFEIKLENKFLNISASRKSDTDIDKEHYKRREFNYTNFNRRFKIPAEVGDESIEARYENGILKLILPKRAKRAIEDAKIIEIQ